MTPIPVLCDQCGAAGLAGSGDFSDLGDLLDFKAVPRQLKRKDGWTGVLQREFIARLARTGSPSLAVEAMGKCLHGVRKLLKNPGSDGFQAAWERAVEIGEAAEARRRIAEQAGIEKRRAHSTAPRRQADPDDGYSDPADAEDETSGEDNRIELVERLIAKFQRKVGLERECRLAGRIVEADFTLRQITALEVGFDLMVDGRGQRGWTMLMEARRGGLNMLEIADTHMARVLDQARRDHWAAMDEPGRPELWPERYVTGIPGSAGDRTEPLEALGKASQAPAGIDPEKWRLMDCDEQQRIYDEQHKRDAEEQVRFEAQSAAEVAEWRARTSTPGSPGEGGHVEHGGGAEAKRRKKK